MISSHYMGNRELRREGVAAGGGAKSDEGGAKTNRSSKESHILKEGPSPERNTEGFYCGVKMIMHS